MFDMTCPQCHMTMLAQPVPERREQIKAMVDRGSTAAYASNFADRRLEKEAQVGVVHRCSACGYTTRVKRAG